MKLDLIIYKISYVYMYTIKHYFQKKYIIFEVIISTKYLIDVSFLLFL